MAASRRRRRSSRQRTTEKERKDKMIKSSESPKPSIPLRMFCLFGRTANAGDVSVCRIQWSICGTLVASELARVTYIYTHAFADSLSLISRCVRCSHTHTHAHSRRRRYIWRSDDRTNGGEIVARATTIRYAIFRMNLFKSIQNGQPNVAHAIYSLSTYKY